MKLLSRLVLHPQIGYCKSSQTLLTNELKIPTYQGKGSLKIYAVHPKNCAHCCILYQFYSYLLVSSLHNSDVMMSAMVSQITCVSIVCSTVCPGVDQRKLQSSASLAFVRAIHRWTMDYPHKRDKGPVTREMFLFDGVIMDTKPSSLKPVQQHWGIYR